MTRVREAGKRGSGHATVVVLTGLSGSGKSQAIRALEDLGYFCVDNLPTPLIPAVAEIAVRADTEIEKAAIVVDVREGRFLKSFPGTYRDLRAMTGLTVRLVFLEASDATLLRRFSETRRPHPLGRRGSVAEAIREERRQLTAIRELADEVIDTSSMNVHDLRRAFMRLFRPGGRGHSLDVTVLSFGFKHGVPADADLMFDVRFLPNPHFMARLRPRTGRAPSVARYVFGFSAAREFLRRAADLTTFLIPHYVTEGKSYLTIAIGCTGGRHRSVAVAEALRRRLGRPKGVTLRVRHRDLGEPA